MITSLVADSRLRDRSFPHRIAAGGSLADSSVAEFPEGLFHPRPEHESRFGEQVTRGYRVMRERKVVLCGVVRDAAEILPRTIARIERIGQLFADYQVVIYENDSRDNTPELLRQWSHRNWRVVVLSETLHDPPNLPIRCPRRGGRMAHYRNQYRDYVEAHYQDFDDVVVADTDLFGGWSYDGIAHTYSQSGWDIMGSFGVIYRRIGWNPNCIHQYDAWAFRLDDDYRALTTKEVNYMCWQRGEPLVPVTSCFGGLGIYRLPAFLAGRYAGGDCEHIGLHRSMRANGYPRIFLNPSQIALYGRKRRRMDRWVSMCQNLLSRSRLTQAPAWL
ncbi:MAG: hypothetical protein ACC628_05505 [Pirellulaceae bacterium]